MGEGRGVGDGMRGRAQAIPPATGHSGGILYALCVSPRALAVVALLASGGGCLSSTHVIPHPDLVALAQTAPEERGARVRVVQGWSGSDEPPPAPHVRVVVIAEPPGPGPPFGRPSPSN